MYQSQSLAQGSVPLGLWPLAPGHVTKGNSLWKQKFESLPPISAESSACLGVWGEHGLSAESGGVMQLVSLFVCDELKGGGGWVWSRFVLPVRAC